MKRLALVNSILETVGGKLKVEVSSLLGCDVVLAPPTVAVLSKEDFFASSLKKLAMARMAAEGERSGEGYIFAQVKDAVLMGGTLIMLPPSELEQRVASDDFSGEEADAFGEIANIIAGVLTTAFDEYFPDKLRFVKKGLETVVPTKVLAESPNPFPDGSYCHAVYGMTMDGQTLNPLQLLFPAELLGLAPEKTAPPPEAAAPPPQPKAQTLSGGANQAAGLSEFFSESSASDSSVPPTVQGDGTAATSPLPVSESLSDEAASSSRPSVKPIQEAPHPAGEPTVLVLAEDPGECGSFTTALQEKGYKVRSLALKDDIRRLLTDEEIRGVFLVLREVTEQGFAAAIRVKSAGSRSVPLIAAGPQWTRKTVLQAVKYGVCDIVITPATPQEIREKIERHLVGA